MSEQAATVMLRVGEREIATTRQGFLKCPGDWDVAVAEAIAAEMQLELTPAHWEIIDFIREYQQAFEHLPNARVFTKAVRTRLGEEKGNSRYLYRLFPDGPLKSVCRLGGLSKPTSCI